MPGGGVRRWCVSFSRVVTSACASKSKYVCAARSSHGVRPSAFGRIPPSRETCDGRRQPHRGCRIFQASGWKNAITRGLRVSSVELQVDQGYWSPLRWLPTGETTNRRTQLLDLRRPRSSAFGRRFCAHGRSAGGISSTLGHLPRTSKKVPRRGRARRDGRRFFPVPLRGIAGGRLP